MVFFEPPGSRKLRPHRRGEVRRALAEGVAGQRRQSLSEVEDALPAGLLTWKMSGAKNRASDLIIAVASGNFTATLVLASLAPIVALYYHTSGYMGGALALGAASLALLVGLTNAVRAVFSRIPGGVTRSTAILPLAVLLCAQLASLVQFIHVASPILPEVTVFDGGMDAIIDGHGGL